MKKLFAVILSLGLILAPIPVVGNAYAEDQDEKESKQSYANMILGLANGIVGSVIITNCKDVPSMTIDHYTYMAGSLAYIGGEILVGKKKGSDVGTNQKEIEKCQAEKKHGGDFQRCTLEAQKKDLESSKRFTEQKIKWTKATLTMYSLATAATAAELICGNIPTCRPFLDASLMCSSTGASKAVQIAVVSAFGYASGGLLGAAMAGGMKAFGSKLGIVADATDKMTNALSSGYARLAFYLGASILVKTILGNLETSKGNIEKRIAKVQKVIDTLEDADNNIAEGQSTSGSSVKPGELAGGVNGNPTRTYDVVSLAGGTQIAKHCWSGSGSSTNFSESGCSSPIRLNKPSFPGMVNIPTLTDGTGAAIDMANAVSSGDLAGADVQADKLIAMAGRITKLKDDLVGKINDDLVKNGKKPIDGKESLKQQIASINDQLNRQNPGSGNFSIGDDVNAGEAGVSASIPASEVPDASGVAAAPAIDSGSLSSVDLSSFEPGSDTVDPNAAGTEKVATLEDSLNDFESNESDIAQDSGVSIFKQVSNRYFLNYTKIFDKKKIADPPLAPQPAKP